MTKTVGVTTSAIAVDRSRQTQCRQTQCRHMQQACEQATTNVKVRVNSADGQPQAVWFYGHVDNIWLKLPETVEGPDFSRLIADELQRLAANPHSAECQVRHKSLRDRDEFEIKFHHDKIVAHQGLKLGSYLFGILFGEGHGAPTARRRGIRRGPNTQVARF